ncbi:SDR family oxidoreductase [Bordetella genomosp. 11]|uniref:Short-chain dehydrogenase n=1 Tax=Bordetella genomosp. 11 TaxID=1416808 RepID=A0A261UM66_9BORD|nr:SDR family oxidoreductase [Bordetella genomosp. 11]OZI62974.1 short-chain dehydrogenase [Bordetella genomosp. 11]
MSLHIVIFGATSGIAQAVARRYATEQAALFLVARDSEKLALVSADLKARGASQVHAFSMDATDYARLDELCDSAWSSLHHVDVVLIAHGTLPDQKRTQTDLDYGVHEFRVNGESAIACMTVLGRRLQEQGRGVLAVIGSVAGDRGRGSNYLYGAAKAAVDAFASGLRARLFKAGVHVLTIKPGFVATPMTAGLDLPPRLTAQPDEVAGDIIRAISRRKDMLYTPGFWRLIMAIIRLVPNFIFKRSKL